MRCGACLRVPNRRPWPWDETYRTAEASPSERLLSQAGGIISFPLDEPTDGDTRSRPTSHGDLQQARANDLSATVCSGHRVALRNGGIHAMGEILCVGDVMFHGRIPVPGIESERLPGRFGDVSPLSTLPAESVDSWGAPRIVGWVEERFIATMTHLGPVDAEWVGELDRPGIRQGQRWVCAATRSIAT